MDISVIKPTEGILEILHPATEQPLGIRVTIISLDDESLKRVKRKIQDEAIKLRQRGKAFSAKETDENQNEICFAAMTGWHWYAPEIEPAKDDKPAVMGEAPDWKGDKAPSFNRKTVMEVFGELEWFRDQVSDRVGETKAFFTV